MYHDLFNQSPSAGFLVFFIINKTARNLSIFLLDQKDMLVDVVGEILQYLTVSIYFRYCHLLGSWLIHAHFFSVLFPSGY